MAKNKWLKMTLAILALVAGLVHVGDSYNLFDLLSIFGSWSNIIQLVAGGATIWFVIWCWMKGWMKR